MGIATAYTAWARARLIGWAVSACEGSPLGVAHPRAAQSGRRLPGPPTGARCGWVQPDPRLDVPKQGQVRASETVFGLLKGALEAGLWPRLPEILKE